MSPENVVTKIPEANTEGRSGMDGGPTPAEIRRQLEKMLVSKRFILNENPSDFLSLVVQKALKGDPIKQSLIGCELFGDKYRRSPISDVRVTASNLRKVLAKYYADEGHEDPVIIALPETPKDPETRLPAGEAYKPLFRYNPRSATDEQYRRGLSYLETLTYVNMFHALECFNEAIRTAPDHSAAHAAKAEALCVFAIYDREPASKSLLLASEAARKAVRLDKKSWRAHAAQGAVYACLWEWQKAGKCFAAALECNGQETRYYFWYAFYLLAIGRRDEALLLSQNAYETNARDPRAKRSYVLFLYATRQNEEAARLLEYPDQVDSYPLDWILHLVRVLISFERNGWPDLLSLNDRFIRMTSDLPLPRCFEHAPGLTVLVWSFLAPDFANMRNGKPVQAAYEEKARERLHKLEAYYQRSHDREPIQLALAYIGVGDFEKAIDELSRGCDDRHPFMAWLNIWPLLDKLRDRERFRELVKRMKLPKHQAALGD